MEIKKLRIAGSRKINLIVVSLCYKVFTIMKGGEK